MKIYLLINMKITKLVDIFMFISREIFMHSYQHENMSANKYENDNNSWLFHIY